MAFPLIPFALIAGGVFWLVSSSKPKASKTAGGCAHFIEAATFDGTGVAYATRRSQILLFTCNDDPDLEAAFQAECKLHRNIDFRIMRKEDMQRWLSEGPMPPGVRTALINEFSQVCEALKGGGFLTSILVQEDGIFFFNFETLHDLAYIKGQDAPEEAVAVAVDYITGELPAEDGIFLSNEHLHETYA